MAKQNRSIHLSHLFSDLTGQLGLVNVNFSLAPQFNIYRTPAGRSGAPSSHRTNDQNTQANVPAAGNTGPAADSPTAFHVGPDPVRQTLISGKRHTLVHPSPDGSFRIVYTKTQSLFTFTLPSSESASPPSEAGEAKGPITKNIDGYRVKFDTVRSIEQADPKDANRENDPDAPVLVGLPLSIYRSGRGTEYFLLTNFYFDPPAQEQNEPAQESSPNTESPGGATTPPSDPADHPSIETGSVDGPTASPDGSAGGPPQPPPVAVASPGGNEPPNGPDYVGIANRRLQITLFSDLGEVTKRTFFLDDPPKKLGDGSFGVVYQVRELLGTPSETSGNERSPPPRAGSAQPGARYALKVFYNRQMMTRTGLIRVEPESFNKLVTHEADQITDVREISIASFMGHIFQSINTSKSPNDVHAQAMAILGQSERLQNVSAKRFGNERNISRSIREVLESEAGVNVNAITCVQTEYDTTRFRDSDMFRFLQEYERKKNSSTADNLSDYAIVMELFNFTLEDLLEAQWRIWRETGVDSDKTHSVSASGEYRAAPVLGENVIAGRDIGSNRDNRPVDDPAPLEYEKIVTGYDMVQSLPFAQRLAVVYPIMEGLSIALQMLHATRNYHHDIKPGNVFINASLKKFYVALGDFSFVGSGVDKGTTEAVLRDSIQTGSLHFRSPEQRDFNDAAYGLVRHSGCCKNPGPEYEDRNVSGGEGWAYVRISDPKFRGSTIGLNDVVVFPADRYGTGYRVIKVESKKDYRDVWLNVDAGEFKKLFPEETRTKVFLYKVPTVRSDLFGLGAVFFDLLTGGQSAERFYEALRPFDAPEELNGREGIGSEDGNKRLTAKDMAQRFDAYRSGTRVGNYGEFGAALSNMFQFFRRGDDFAPREVVEIIVKLMGGNLADSYMNTNAAERPVPKHLQRIAPEALPVSWALQDIEAVEKKGIYDWRDGLGQKGADNLLLRPEQSQQLLEIVVEAQGAVPAGSEGQAEKDVSGDKDKAKPKSWIDRLAERLGTVPRTS